MSGIMLSLDYSRRVAIDQAPLSENRFTAKFLLNPDGDIGLSSDYGYITMTLSGDAQKIPNKTLSEIEDWLQEAVVTMLKSKMPSA